MNKKAAIIISALGIVIVVGSMAFTTWQKNKKAAEVPQETIMMLKKQDLSKTISVAGTITSANKRVLGSEATDVKVVDMRVKIGDIVKKGDVLCVLDSSDAMERKESMQKTIEIEAQKTQIELETASHNLERVELTRNIELERGNKSVADAYQEYEKAVGKKEKAYAAWQASLKNQQIGVTNKDVARSSSAGAESKVRDKKDNLRIRQESYDAAEKAYQEAKEKKITVSENQVKTEEQESQENALRELEDRRNKAKEELSRATASYNEAEYKSTDKNSQKADAESAYAEAKTQVNTKETEYNEANTAVENAIKAYTKEVTALQDTTLSSDKNLAEQSQGVKTAKLNEELTKYTETKQTLRKYERLIDACTVVAPFDGTVTSIGVQTGEIYKAGEIVTLQDTSKYLVSTVVDQYSISDVVKDQKVFVYTEAGSGENSSDEKGLGGKVVFVSPVPQNQESMEKTTTAVTTGTTTNNNSDYRVDIALNKQNERLRLGMKVKTTIVLKEEKNVYVLPYNCIREEENKNYILTKQGKVEVKKGLETDYYVQVIADSLKEGLEVIVPEFMEAPVEGSEKVE